MVAASNMKQQLPVRWRRWVRPRRRTAEVDAVRTLVTRSVELPMRWRTGTLPEAHIVCEGWLLRHVSGQWLTHWCLLVVADGEAALLYCNSIESMRMVEALSSPPAPLHTTKWPAVPLDLALQISAEQLKRSFGLGSARAAEGVLHCAPSETECARWQEALAEAAALIAEPEALIPLPAAAQPAVGAAMQPAQLCVHIVGATGLAATERDGTTDPYVKLTFKGSRRTQRQQSSVLRGTCSPRWAEVFAFDGVLSEDAQLLLHVKDWNRLTLNETCARRHRGGALALGEEGRAREVGGVCVCVCTCVHVCARVCTCACTCACASACVAARPHRGAVALPALKRPTSLGVCSAAVSRSAQAG